MKDTIEKHFTAQTINTRYSTVHEVFDILKENNFDKNLVKEKYNPDDIKVFDGYCAFYFPDKGEAKELYTCLKYAGYGIAVTTENGYPHTHKYSTAINIILNLDNPKESVGFRAGDETVLGGPHGQILYHGDRFIIPPNEVHGHIVNAQCITYRKQHPKRFPLWQEASTTITNHSKPLTFFFLQLCDFNNSELHCHEDFHNLDPEKSKIYYDNLYTKIYWSQLATLEKQIQSEKTLLQRL